MNHLWNVHCLILIWLQEWSGSPDHSYKHQTWGSTWNHERDWECYLSNHWLSKPEGSLIYLFLKIEIRLIYIAELISALQHSDSVIHTYTSVFLAWFFKYNNNCLLIGGEFMCLTTFIRTQNSSILEITTMLAYKNFKANSTNWSLMILLCLYVSREIN